MNHLFLYDDQRDMVSETHPETRAGGILIAGENNGEKRTSYRGGIRPAWY